MGSEYKAMDKAQVYALIRKAQGGDMAARETLVEQNAGLVNSVAGRFVSKGYEYEDIVQLGYIGLIKAIDGFKTEFDVMFSTYAVPMIIGEIRRFMRDDGKIKVSRMVKQEVSRLNAAEEEFIGRNGRNPKISELAEIMGEEREYVAELLEAKNAVSSTGSLDDEQYSQGIPSKHLVADDDYQLDLIDLKDAIKNLKERERQIIVLRYLKDMTQQQIGNMLGISQVQVSRVEKRVLNSIKKQLE